jgi:hypothetical protein
MFYFPKTCLLTPLPLTILRPGATALQMSDSEAIAAVAKLDNISGTFLMPL